MNTYSITIIINQRFWKEVPTTVDQFGAYDWQPALTEVNNAVANNGFAFMSIRKPSELTSIELRPNTMTTKPKTI